MSQDWERAEAPEPRENTDLPTQRLPNAEANATAGDNPSRGIAEDQAGSADDALPSADHNAQPLPDLDAPTPAVVEGPFPIPRVESASGPLIDPTPAEDTTFRKVVEAFALLAGETMSVAMFFVLTLWIKGDSLTKFTVANQLATKARNYFLLDMFVPAAIVCLLAGGLLLRFGLAWATPLRSFARRLSPLLLVGFLPVLFRWQNWHGRELALFALAALLVWICRRTVKLALSEPPWPVGAWAGRFARKLRPNEKVSALLPTLAVSLSAAAYATYFAYITIEDHYKLGTCGMDLALETNLLWNLLHGDGPPFKSSPIAPDPNNIHFGFHATVFSYLLVPFYAIYQRAETLLALQSALVGAAALPLYWFARRHVGRWPAAIIAMAYLLHPGVQGSNLYDFHYPPLAPFFVWLALYAFEAKKDLLGAVAVAVTLTIREDVAASVVIVGGYLAIWGRRPKAGALIMLVAVVYAGLLKFVLMPAVAKTPTFMWIYGTLMPPGESGFGNVIKTIIGNPSYTLSTLIVDRKIAYFIQLLAPLAFLPLMRGLGWFCLLPGLMFSLFTAHEPLYTLGFQYAAHYTSYIFLGLVFALSEQARPHHPGDREGGVRRIAWLASLVFATLVFSYQYGVVFQQNVAKAGFDPVKLGITETDRKRNGWLQEAIAIIPPDAKISASERVVAHVANREDAYRIAEYVNDAEYILVDLRTLRGDEKKLFRENLGPRGDFGVIHVFGDIVVARRGAPHDQNLLVLRRTGR